jgi:hypothetical protein
MEHEHWSDCAMNNGPAYEAGPCDCGGLNLAVDAVHLGIVPRVPAPGSLRPLSGHPETKGLIETK